MIEIRISHSAVNNVTNVELSAPQDSPRGKLLADFYYQGVSQQLKDLGVRVSGYPHNGGEHTLWLQGSNDDVRAYLELMAEIFEPYEKYAIACKEIRDVITKL